VNVVNIVKAVNVVNVVNVGIGLDPDLGNYGIHAFTTFMGRARYPAKSGTTFTS